MKKRSLVVTSVAACLAQGASAHDFWLTPSAFRLDEPGDIRVAFEVGHADEVTPWNLRWDRVVSLQKIGGGELIDLQGGIVPPTQFTPAQARVSFERPGSQVVAFASYHSVSELGGEKFTEYAELEGLSAILEDRERTNTADRPGREIYSRRAKTLIQVGDELTSDILRPVGQTLEIVPERHPYDLGPDRRLPVRVYFRGEPLAGALVDLTDLSAREEPFVEARTDADGRAVFEIPGDSAYKLNVIWSVPDPGNDRADYETIFSSLTFGYGDD